MLPITDTTNSNPNIANTGEQVFIPCDSSETQMTPNTKKRKTEESIKRESHAKREKLIPLIKKQRDIPETLQIFLPAKLLDPSIKLSIELVPSTSWFNNIRNHISQHYWKLLRQRSLFQANHQCELCMTKGDDKKLECHERWEYQDESNTQKLLGLITLCQDCHEVKHAGLAQKKRRLSIVIKHLQKVNHWDYSTANNYVTQCFRTWRERSKKQWQLDLTWLDVHNIPLKKTHLILDNELTQAINSKNLEKIKTLMTTITLESFLESTEDTHQKNYLHFAVETKDENLIATVLTYESFRALINKGDKNKKTPFHLAVELNLINSVKLMKEQGADLQLITIKKKSVIHLATKNKNLEILKLLLNSETERFTHQYDSYERLPIHYIFQIKHDQVSAAYIDRPLILELFYLLIPYLSQQEFYKVDRYNRALLYYAIGVLTKTELENIKTKFDITDVLKQVDNYGKTLLHCAAKEGNVDAVNFILTSGNKALINQTDNNQKTPLHEAVIYINDNKDHHQTCIQILLDNGATFNVKSNSGSLTAFDEAYNKMGVEEAFKLFSPYMQMTNAEKTTYLNQLRNDLGETLMPNSFLKTSLNTNAKPHTFFTKTIQIPTSNTQSVTSSQNLKNSPLRFFSSSSEKNNIESSNKLLHINSCISDPAINSELL